MAVEVQKVILFAGIGLLIIGGLGLISGIAVLISNVFSKDIQTVQEQAAKLAKKGVTEDISGALGNASFLLREMNTMVETGRGIGMFLVIVGVLLIIGGMVVLKRLV
mgnify:FL=1